MNNRKFLATKSWFYRMIRPGKKVSAEKLGSFATKYTFVLYSERFFFYVGFTPLQMIQLAYPRQQSEA